MTEEEKKNKEMNDYERPLGAPEYLKATLIPNEKRYSRRTKPRPRVFGAVADEEGRTYWVLPKQIGRLLVKLHAVGEEGSQELPLAAVEPGDGCSEAFLDNTTRKRNRFVAEIKEISGRVKVTLVKPGRFAMKVVINKIKELDE